MAHCPYEQLADLEAELAQVRTWESIRENSPGVFYWKRIPFCHFHTNKAGECWADVRASKTAWGPQIDIPPGASKTARAAFLKELRKRYEGMGR